MVKEQFKNVIMCIIIIWKHFLYYTVFAWVPPKAEPLAESLRAIPLLRNTILGSRGEGWVERCKVKERSIYPMVPTPVGQRVSSQDVKSPEFPVCTWGGIHHYRLVCIFYNSCKWIKVCVFFCLFFFHSA